VLVGGRRPGYPRAGDRDAGNYGAQAEAVASVAEARRVFAKSPPDVLVCDIALPDEDGLA